MVNIGTILPFISITNLGSATYADKGEANVILIALLVASLTVTPPNTLALAGRKSTAAVIMFCSPAPFTAGVYTNASSPFATKSVISATAC